MVEHIPISFCFKGKQYTGHFSAVSGSGGSHAWHLMLNGNFYYGTLRLLDYWVFHESGNQIGIVELTDYFAAVVISWYE